MGKNINGGNKTKSLKNKKDKIVTEIPEPSNEYNSHVGKIEKVLSSEIFDYKIVDQNGTDPTIYRARARLTKQRGGRRVLLGKYVLVQPREFNNNERDIIFTYNDSEIPFLVNKNIIKINETEVNDVMFSDVKEDNIDFSNV